jgi:hypothetical protein
VPNVAEIIKDRVTLEVRCLDRLYLNGYVPRLQSSGGVVDFLVRACRQKIASPAVFGQITTAFTTALCAWADQHGVLGLNSGKASGKTRSSSATVSLYQVEWCGRHWRRVGTSLDLDRHQEAAGPICGLPLLSETGLRRALLHLPDRRRMGTRLHQGLQLCLSCTKTLSEPSRSAINYTSNPLTSCRRTRHLLHCARPIPYGRAWEQSSVRVSLESSFCEAESACQPTDIFLGP